MSELLKTASQNLSFLLIALLICAGLIAAAVLADRLLSGKRHRLGTARTITFVAMFSALSAVLMLLEIPLFFAPSFYKLDFSEIPVLICGFYLGPTAGVICELLKVLLKLLFRGTATAFVGEFANFVVGCSFILPATVLYQKFSTKKGALVGMAAGTAVLAAFGSAFNAWYLLPKFAELYGMPLDAIIAMASEVNHAVKGVGTLVLFAVVPFNLLKGAVVSLLTFLLYKRVANFLFRDKK